MEITSTTQTLTKTTVQVPGGREFVAVYFTAPDGTPEDLLLSVDYSDQHGWRNRAGVLALPPDSLPHIVRALQQLQFEADR
jgi:hypothetical protein